MTRTKVEEFRRLAQECRATAQTLSTEQARTEMLAMAEVCDRVVAQQTHVTDLSEAGVPPASTSSSAATGHDRFTSLRPTAEFPSLNRFWSLRPVELTSSAFKR